MHYKEYLNSYIIINLILILIIVPTCAYSDTFENFLQNSSKSIYYSLYINQSNEISMPINNIYINNSKMWLKQILSKYYYDQIKFENLKYYKNAHNNCDAIYYYDNEANFKFIINSSQIIIISKINISDPSSDDEIINLISNMFRVNFDNSNTKFITSYNNIIVYFKKHKYLSSWRETMKIIIYENQIYFVTIKFDNNIGCSVIPCISEKWLNQKN